jgi:anti-sigma-K factor RskA
MSLSHQELQIMTAGYVLGVLDESDGALMEAHLADCATCAAEVRSLVGAVDALARSLPQRAPPADLRDRVLAAVRGARPVVTAHPRPRWERFVRLPIAASVLFALGAGIYGSHLHVETRLAALSERAEATSREIAAARREAVHARAAMEILAAPDAIRMDLQGRGSAANATARVLWTRDHGMIVAATNLAAAPPGHHYHVWVITDGAAIRAGVLPEQDRGFAVFDTPPDVPQPRGIRVTIEPAGGVSAQSGNEVLVGNRLSPF